MYMFISKIDDMRRIFSPGDNICSYYLIDRFGRIFSEYSGSELKQVVTENGYKAISLNTTDGKRIQRKVHRLLMFTFCYFPGCENYQVNHKDGNKFKNEISNLEWVTPKENIYHAINNNLRKSWSCDFNPNAKLTSEEVLIIVDMVLKGYNNNQIINSIPNCNESIIAQIILGNTWNSLISPELVQQMKNIRHPIILSIEQKHQLCKYYQDNPCIYNYHGCKKDYVIEALNNLNIIVSDSTYRMAKRLYYKYQDPEITSLYNY